MKEISANEERMMRVLWRIGQGLVRDILNELDEPKPPYTTIASTVRLLESKGYLTHKVYGNTHMYIPLISQEEYSKGKINHMVSNFFQGSVSNFLSFMVNEKKISKNEIKDLQKLIDDAEKNAKK
ncbi:MULTISPECIES: BlaI/MecI/CopY family transcriptional regulator [Algoriphagus]|jgi:predicted transcriptional regulator|uniref:BlaI/MecI/CopY family transcriptional regulator n=2 Tax=Algoriphagus TaxID=246875 RepID=A0ABS7N246_9BACT|nr:MULTISPECIES: BlaI/MecI/CopY family transcriptional regulator [Algoriphagus]MBY5950381.1 BlaI/MecI/CopY family transcriptional regulator [Algoriphagus marincola]MCR9084930.1 BlaI/MecI/CopY family transcriptional regulator [Cyclobacteriaceae bacterium]TDK42630.1 BlaI/MecI/CopY family transcriptional regulator [Algoriphagus aquimaris]